jgi:hypothetical protein
MSVPTTARSAKAQEFLDETKADPPKQAAARGTYNEYVQVLDSLDAAGWDRFFDLQEEKSKPVAHVLKYKAIARTYPADHAYCLLMRLTELDKPWWDRNKRRIYFFFGLPAVTTVGGTAWLWATEHGDWLWDNVIRPLLGLLSLLGFLINFASLLVPETLAELLRSAAAALERVAAALERVAAALERERSGSRTETRSDTMSGTM